MIPSAFVLYDGDCGFCSRGAARWKGVLERRGIATAALQEPWVAARLAVCGVPPGDALDDLRILVDATGEVVSGADAYRWAFRRIWWARPLWLLSVAPGLRRLFDRGYRAFADNRHRISRACRIERPR